MSASQSILATKMILRHLMDAAILLAHMMFGLPPAMQCEPPFVATLDPFG
jgi:hypothetical protein